MSCAGRNTVTGHTPQISVAVILSKTVVSSTLILSRAKDLCTLLAASTLPTSAWVLRPAKSRASG